MADEIYEKLAQAVLEGEPEDAEALAKQALEQGADPLACINEGLMKGIRTRAPTRTHHENAGCCRIFAAVPCSVLFCAAIISTQPPKSHFSRNL